MNGQTFVTIVTLLPAMQRRLVIALLLLLTIPLGTIAIVLSPPGSSVATWWPAAAFSIVAVLCSRGNRLFVLIAVAAVITGSNLAAGRPLPLALAFGIANALEAWIVVSIAGGRHRNVEIVSIVSAIRLLLAILAGGVVLGLLAGGAVAVLAGGDFTVTSVSLMTSHLSAVVILLPLALTKPSDFRVTRWKEFAAQLATLAVFVIIAFAPWQPLPLTFLPYPVLAWAAIRFGTGVLVAELIAVAVAVTALTSLGGGPFAIDIQGDPTITTHLIQAFVVITAGSMLVIAKGETERAQLVTRVRSREKVLRSALLGSAGGFVIMENTGGSEFRLTALNEQASSMFELHEGLQVGSVIRAQDFPAKVTYHVRRARLTPGLEWDGDLDVPGEVTTLRVHVTRIDDVEGGYVVVVQAEDTTTRTRAATALANALENERAIVDRLQELGRQQQDFVAAVSHELRTPLTSIVGFTDELRDLELEEPAPTYLDVVHRNVRRLSGLVEDLLYASRMTATSTQRDVAEFDLDALIAETREDMVPLASGRGVTVTVVSAAPVGSIDSVRGEVARILTNIVSNAVKFTPDGGTVRLVAEREEHGVTIRVIDDGPGIPVEDLEKVFERFYRAASAAQVPGTGLGLAITRGLAERLGGAVHLESDGTHGTTAVVWLPLAAPREAADTLPTPVQGQ